MPLGLIIVLLPMSPAVQISAPPYFWKEIQYTLGFPTVLSYLKLVHFGHSNASPGKNIILSSLQIFIRFSWNLTWWDHVSGRQWRAFVGSCSVKQFAELMSAKYSILYGTFFSSILCFFLFLSVRHFLFVINCHTVCPAMSELSVVHKIEKLDRSGRHFSI